MNLIHKHLTGLLTAGLIGVSGVQAYDWEKAEAELSPKQKSIAQTAAWTAVGNIKRLKKAFSDALNNGLSINELKEIVLQMYAYTGFPRCLNASGALEEVLRERQKRGKNDILGAPPQPLAAESDKYELGKKNLEVLTASSLPSHPPVFIQATDTFLKEHLFADIFARGVLSYSEREIATVSALAALGNVTPQLQAHISMAMNVGVTAQQIEGIMAVIKQTNGRKTATAGLHALEAVLKSRPTQP